MSAIMKYPRAVGRVPKALSPVVTSVPRNEPQNWLLVKLLSGLLLVILVLNPLSPYRVDGYSMEPHLHSNERLIVNTQAYDLSAPHRGDVIVFADPRDPRETYIKRIIGLPDDTIEIHGGQIFINGHALPDSYKVFSAHGDMAPHLILSDHYFVMGDNRDQSDDSRFWGDISCQAIIGQAVARYWPISRCKLLK